MIECGYFLGLTNKGFIKEVKMDDYTHEENSLPKIGENFTGRYTDESPCSFIGLVNAYKDGELIFITKNNRIEKVNKDKLNKRIIHKTLEKIDKPKVNNFRLLFIDSSLD